MTRFTTPTYKLEIDGLSNLAVADIRVSFRQGTNIVTISGNDLYIDGDEVTLKLTQEQTGSFKSNACVGIQARGLLDDDTAWATNIIKEHVYPVLEEGVITSA